MKKNDAVKALNVLVKNENLKRHHFAAGICMRAVALYLKEKNKKPGFSLPFLPHEKDASIDENKWEIVGLLHDADYERTKDRPKEHGVIIADEIRSQKLELAADEFEAIKFHNKDNVPALESLMGWGIWTVDELTGLIVACALVRPDKKLASVTVDFVMQKMKEPAFAKGAIRERIYDCEPKLGIKLDEFVKICLTAMQGIAQELGL